MSEVALLAIGMRPATALGRAVGADPRARAVAPPDLDAALRAAPPASGVIVGVDADDAAAVAMTALSARRPVLFEPLASTPPAALRSLAEAADAAGTSAVAALRRRHEVALAQARSHVAAGAIGLPFAVAGEALRSAAADARTELLDLLDAIADVAGLAPRSLTRMGRPGARGRGPEMISVAFDRGASGVFSARLGTSRTASADADELASFRVMGSHGTIGGDLDAPALEVLPERSGDRSRGGSTRLDRPSAAVLVEAFADHVAGADRGRLADLHHAATLAALPGWRSRSAAGR